MNGLILLLYCMDILGALLCGANTISELYSNNQGITTGSTVPNSSTSPAFQKTTSLADPASTYHSKSKISGSMSTQSSTTVSRVADIPRASPPPVSHTTATTPAIIFYKKECLQVMMVAGGLILACSILLVSTVLLAWKVCQLSRRITLLISNSEYWIETGKKNKSKSETEAKETSILTANVGQSTEEMANGTTKDDGGKVNEDGQMEEENKKVVDVSSEVAPTNPPVAVSDNSSFLKPQEEATDSQSTKAVVASSSEGAVEPKEVV